MTAEQEGVETDTAALAALARELAEKHPGKRDLFEGLAELAEIIGRTPDSPPQSGL